MPQYYLYFFYVKIAKIHSTQLAIGSCTAPQLIFFVNFNSQNNLHPPGLLICVQHLSFSSSFLNFNCQNIIHPSSLLKFYCQNECTPPTRHLISIQPLSLCLCFLNFKSQNTLHPWAFESRGTTQFILVIFKFY